MVGSNNVDFFINNTVNASLGPESPTSFNPGSYTQTEVNVNFDLSYAASDRINLATGTRVAQRAVQDWCRRCGLVGDRVPMPGRVSVPVRTDSTASGQMSRRGNGTAATLRSTATLSSAAKLIPGPSA